MPFVNQTILKRQLGQNLVKGFATANANAFERQLIPQCDRIITRLTGKQPPAEPVETPDDTSDDVQIQMYAAWIIHFLMIPLQGGVSPDEYRNRERAYERALKELPMYGATAVNATYAAPIAEYKSTKRVGDMP
jgi:hypothetical protein